MTFLNNFNSDLNLKLYVKCLDNNLLTKIFSTNKGNKLYIITEIQNILERYQGFDIIVISIIIYPISIIEFKELCTSIIVHNLTTIENIYLNYKIITELFINTIKSILDINEVNIIEKLNLISDNLVSTIYNVIKVKLNDLKINNTIVNNNNIINKLLSFKLMSKNINSYLNKSNVINEIKFMNKNIMFNKNSSLEKYTSELELELNKTIKNMKLINKLRANIRYYNKVKISNSDPPP
jgi:hypothetical protein